MENKLKDFLDSLTAEQETELIEIINEREKNKKTGYEKPKEGERYYYIEDDGSLGNCWQWQRDTLDDGHWENANCYTIKEVAEADARADLLMRKLRRFAKLENANTNVNYKTFSGCCYIFYNRLTSSLIVNDEAYKYNLGQIYFNSEELAKKAIEEFREELEWYFTEYLNNW